MTPEQQEEVLKLQKIIKQCEGIIRTSRNPATLQRIKVDLKKAKDRLDYLCPHGIPESLTYKTENTQSQKVDINSQIQSYTYLSLFPVRKLSVHCEDESVNFLFTSIDVWDTEFSPSLADQHVKLDFSMSSERDSHYTLISGLKRQIKTLADIIEDVHAAIREESKAQLRDMKVRHARQFTTDSSAFFQKNSEFWSTISNDIQASGSMCTNPDDIIRFDGRLQVKTFLDQKTVHEAIHTTEAYIKEVLDVIKPIHGGLR